MKLEKIDEYQQELTHFLEGMSELKEYLERYRKAQDELRAKRNNLRGRLNNLEELGWKAPKDIRTLIDYGVTTNDDNI
jgi:uncharacterized coiled-coil DUF342 family protein